MHKVYFAENGISEIIDIATNKAIFTNGKGGLFTGNINGTDCESKGVWSVDTTALGAKAVYCGEIGGLPLELTMSFSGKSKRIDCKTRVTVKNDLIGRTDITQGRPVPLTLNGHHHEDKLCLSLNVNVKKDRKMFRDLPYSISEWNGALRKTEKYWYPNDDILIDTEVSPEESFNATTYYHGIYWLNLRDDERGLAIFNKGCMGCALTGNYLQIPLIYSNEYMCGTRILNGTFENEFAIFPFSADISNTQLHKEALVYAQPPVACCVSKGNGDSSEISPINLETDSEEIILTALYPEKDYILARFCNYSDNNSTAKLTSTYGNIVAETDLLGNELKEITDNGLNFHPWEIKTVKIYRR